MSVEGEGEGEQEGQLSMVVEAYNYMDRVEQILNEKGVEQTLDFLQEALRMRKAKADDLERFMMKTIDLSVEHLNRRTLKDDLSLYRNIMQHDNNKSLEKVHKYLRDSIEAKVANIQATINEVVEIEDVDTA
mmetsp:Transcript_42768/g.50131  ORF Transcript_42768/g.50131 Transcript_42768/m.50131 type:complete len:132 (+) Transcript_42768:33-428(+)